MNCKFPHVASKEEIQDFISNIKLFLLRSESFIISKDLFSPIQFTEKINSVSKDQKVQQPRIKEFKSISSLISFFKNLENSNDHEIPIIDINGTINLISSGQTDLQLIFSVYIRSLSLLIKYFLSADFNNVDQINKSLIEKSIEWINSLPIQSSFYPEMPQHPLIDFEFLNNRLMSPTSICVSNDFIFILCEKGKIAKYKKKRFFSVSRFHLNIPSDFGIFSMIYVDDKLFLINSNQKCISIDTKEKVVSSVHSTALTYPTISDGRYVYSVKFEEKPKVQIFNSKFEKVGDEIELILPVSVSLSIEMPISTNGSFINFIDNEKCHIFSLLNGRFIRTQNITMSLYSIAYDFTYNGFVCLSENGLVEIPAKSTAPPWILNYKIGLGEIDDLKDNFLNALSMLAMHFVGGQSDVPLSELDDECLGSLENLLNYLMLQERMNDVIENAMIATLAFIQVKSRRFSKLPLEIDQKLFQIFSDEKFMFARRSASFLFLSCIKIFENKWNKNHTKLFTLIVNDKNCSDFVFSFLNIFSFDVPDLDEDFYNSILNLMMESTDNQWFKALIILYTIQEKLINKLPESETIFTSYIINLLKKVTDKWSIFLSSGDTSILSSNYFITLKLLEMQLMKKMDTIDLPIILIEKFLEISGLESIETEKDEKVLDTLKIFNVLLLLALYFAFKKIEGNAFIILQQKVDSNHSQISIEDFQSIEHKDSKEVELLIKCANESNWHDKSEITNFLDKTKGKVESIEMLEKRIDQIHRIQPQPLRKIHHFLVTGEFNTIEYKNSAIYQLLNYEHWNLHSDNRLVFAIFLSKFEKFQDDFLCIPPSSLKKFVKNCPSTVLLPLSFIQFSKVKLNESMMDLHEIQLSYDKISACITKDQSKDFIKPLLNLRTNITPHKREVKRVLLLAIIGFRKSDMKEVNDEIIQKLVHCRKAVASKKMMKYLLEIVKIFAFKSDHRIFNFIIEIIGGCILKRKDIFPNANNIRAMFQFAYEFVEFARELMTKSNDFRDFLSSSEVLGNENEEEDKKSSHSTLNENDIYVIKKLAFLTIVNNLLSFPVVGSTFTAVDNKMEEIESKISRISKNGHRVTLENGQTYDIRNLFHYNITSPHHIDSEIFNDEQIERIVIFFNIFHKYFRLNATSAEMTINNSELALKLRPLISILYFTSLQCLSFNEKFVIQFHGIYSLSDMMLSSKQSSGEVIIGNEFIVLEPINDKTVFRRFWEFYSQPSTLDFSIFESKDGYSTSPISPNTHLSVRFYFSGMCEATLYCCLANSESMSEMRNSRETNDSAESFVFQELNDQALVYQTVTFSDYFDFVLDADSQQVSMISQDKTATFPVFNSAIFYSIFLKAKHLTFENRNKQWPLDKISSFESFDFSTFKLCSFNHMLTVPCKSFEDSFLNELGIIIRNKCMKTIVTNMVKVKPIDPSLCVSYLTVMLSNFEELFKNHKLKSRLKGFIEINTNKNFDIPKITQIFLMYVRNTLYNAKYYVIWRNNSYAKPVKKGTIVCNCVIFAPEIIKVADKKTEIQFDCFIVPKEHLNRTAIELLMFSKNALIFCKETNNEKAFNEVIDIMHTCQKEKIPGFTDSDLKSVDTIIKEVIELCDS